MIVELIGIEDIVPNAVEATCDGSNRREEGVAYPDGKHGVLLPKSLSCRDFILVSRPYLPPEPKLHDAAAEGNCHEPKLRRHRHRAVNDAPRCHRCCQCEGNGPEIKRKVLIRGQPPVQSWQRIPNDDGTHQRQQQ